MSLFNRAILRPTAAFLKSAPKARMMQQPTVASFSSLLEKKELADESRYIRDLEKRRQEDMRKKLEHILSLEDSAKEKQDLAALLGEKEPQGFIQKWGLNDWKFAIPVGLLLGTPAVFNEVLIIDAEFQLTACFLLFAATMYTQAGPVIAKSLDEYAAETEKELNATNATMYNSIGSSMDANTQALALEEDLKTLHTVTDQIAVAQAEVLNQLEEVKYRDAIVKKLEALHALEENVSSQIRHRIVNTVKSDVMKTFKSDKKIQENALNQAIAVLASGSGAKLGKDIVGEVFVNSIKTYKDNYAKQPEGSDEILRQLEKDVAAITSAPEIASKGGNVFETHKLAA